MAASVDRQIETRRDDLQETLEAGEEAYERHKEEWEREYAGQYIAIYQGEVVASDAEKSKLIEKIIDLQRQKGRFRSYVVKVGAPVLKVRKPPRRLSWPRGGG